MYKFWTVFFIILKFVFSKYDTQPLSLISYDQLDKLIKHLQNLDSIRDVMKIKNVFEIYDKIPRPNCDAANKEPCNSYLIEIADFSKGEEYVRQLPTILLIAGFHGNEVIGTNTFYYFLKSFSKHYQNNNYYNNLVKNVRILMLPTANVNGFANLRREEFLNGHYYDPNRDFPFNIENQSDKCFQTSTAMVIDSIYRSNLIVGSFTFHGGDNSISYPWGNYAHQKDPITGDNTGYDQIVQKFTQIAGGNQSLNIEPYRVGNLHDTVYDVYGGFEDWAYGASWDTKNVPRTCSMYDDFSNYFHSNDISYDDQSNRCFIYLVEAGYQKIPDENTLGNELSFYEPTNKKSIYGHLARNIRLSLSFSEIMNPFLRVQKITYDQNLKLVLELRGCLTLDEFSVDNLSALEKEISHRQLDPISNTIIINVEIKKPFEDLSQISFGYTCDQNWKQEFDGKKHEAHLVRMRVQDDYNVEYKGYKIKSQKKMQSHLLNIDLTKMQNASIKQIQKNIHNIVYSNIIQAVTKDNVINLTLGQNQKVTSDQHHSKLVVHSLASKKNQPRHLMLLQEDQEISEQNFYDLVGTEFDIEDEKGIKRSGHFQINEDSSLFIPQNGLFTKKSFDFGAYVVEAIPKSITELQFAIRFNGRVPKSLSVGSISLNLPKNIEKELSYNLIVKDCEVDISNLNQFRILGKKIKLYDDDGEIILEEYLLQRNSYIKNYDQGFFGITQNFDKKQKIEEPFYFKYSHYVFASFILMILVTALTIIFVQKKKQKSLRDIETKVLNEMEIIDNQYFQFNLQLMTQVLNVEAKEIHEWLLSRFKLQKNWFFKYRAVKQKQKETLTKIKRDLFDIDSVSKFFDNQDVEKIDFLDLEKLDQILVNSSEGQKRNFFNQYSSTYIKELRALMKLQQKQFMHIASLGKDINEYLQFTLPSNYKVMKENQSQIQLLEYKASQAISSIKMTQKDIFNLIEELIPQYKVENLQEFSLNDFLNNFVHQLPKLVENLEKKFKDVNMKLLIEHYRKFQNYNYPDFQFDEQNFKKLEQFCEIGDFFENDNKFDKIDLKKYIDQKGFGDDIQDENEWITEMVDGELQLVQKVKDQEEQIGETVFVNRKSREQLVLCLEELYFFTQSRIEEIENSTQADLEPEFFDLTQQLNLETLQQIHDKIKQILSDLQCKKINNILSILEDERNKTKITMRFEKYLNLIEKNKHKKNFCEEKIKELQSEIGKSRREIRDVNQKVIRLRVGIEKLLKQEFKNDFILVVPKLKK